MPTNESNYTPFVNVESNPNWTLMFGPTTNNRYNPKQFHVGMWDEWTNEICRIHIHKVKKRTARSAYGFTYEKL